MTDLRKKVGHSLLLVPGVAAMIRDVHGHILLQQTKEGKWNLPAGAIDPGETAAQAIVREVREESGLVVRPTRLIGILGGGMSYRTTYNNGDVVESTTSFFECDVVGGELKPQDDETATLKYFPANAIPDLPIPVPKEFFSDRDLTAFFEWDEEWLRAGDD